MKRPIEALEKLADNAIFVTKLESEHEPSSIAIAKIVITDYPDEDAYIISPGAGGDFLKYRIEGGTPALIETTTLRGALDVRLPDGTRYMLAQTINTAGALIGRLHQKLEFEYVQMTEYKDFVRARSR